MKGVFGKPFVCLDQYVDIERLMQIVEDINYGIAKSHSLIKPNFAATYQTDQSSDQDKASVKDFGSAYRCWKNDLDPIRQTRGKLLLETDLIAFEFWLQYEYKVTEVVSYLVLRDYVKEFSEQYEPCDRLKSNNFEFNWTETANNFPELKDWCSSLPFKQLGPVVLLLKNPGEPFPLHRDLFYDNDQYNHQEQFMWFNPLGSRNLYVFDNENGIKYAMDNGVGFYWNNHDWHGGIEACQTASWTIRIEGIFEDWLVEDLVK